MEAVWRITLADKSRATDAQSAKTGVLYGALASSDLFPGAMLGEEHTHCANGDWQVLGRRAPLLTVYPMAMGSDLLCKWGHAMVFSGVPEGPLFTFEGYLAILAK